CLNHKFQIFLTNCCLKLLSILERSAWYLGALMQTGKQAIYYEGLHLSTTLGVEEATKVLEPNVPTHGLSTLAFGIFYVCLGKEIEATYTFEQFAANHCSAFKPDPIFEMGDELQWRLLTFHAPYSNT
ncbi:unnamed protein product, partial [Brassica oleracea]